MNFFPNEPGYQPRVLLIGGTSEIGLAILAALALPPNAQIILAGRDEQRLTAAGKELGGQVTTVPYDALDTAGHQAFVDAVFADGHLDLVISAAGVLVPQADLERDVLRAAELIETNFTGHVSTLLAVAARMRAQGRGTIVVLSSVAAVRPRKANPVYGSAKAGLDAFARGFADLLHGTGVRVVLVRPGFVTGRMTAGMPPAPLATTPEAVGRATAAALRRGQDTVWVPPALAALAHALTRPETHLAPYLAVSSSAVDSDAVRVLVAEDDEGLGQVLARGLREQGYVVDLVPDGETAAAYLRFYEYEVAVLDWRMPRLSGLDLVQRMRRAGTATPVLMLTARDTPADRIAGLDAGADDYLVKPFDFGELLARLRALQRQASGQPLAPAGDRRGRVRPGGPGGDGVRAAPRVHRHRAGHPGDLDAPLAQRRGPPLDRPARLGQRGRRLRLEHHRRAPGPAALQAGRRRGPDRDHPRRRLPDHRDMKASPGNLSPAARVAAAATAVIAVLYVIAVIVFNVLFASHQTAQSDYYLGTRLTAAATDPALLGQSARGEIVRGGR